MFDIADSDGNGSLTFDEFILGVCIVCTLTRDQLLYFVFRCFDLDNSGGLSTHEFVLMSEAVNEAGGGFFDGNFAQLVDKFDANGDGNVDFGEFLMVKKIVTSHRLSSILITMHEVQGISTMPCRLPPHQVDTYFPMAFYPVFR